MKAKMTVTKLELRKIKLMQDTGRVGHNFELVAKVRVQPRTMGALSGEGIDCPELQWIETIDWYRFDTFTNNWIQAGTQTRNKDLYKGKRHRLLMKSVAFPVDRPHHYRFGNSSENRTVIASRSYP